MINHSTDNWSLCVGRPGDVELRVHILWPLTALAVLFAVKSKAVEPTLAIWGLGLFMASVMIHEIVRVFIAARVGGHTSAVVLGPIGGLTKLHLPVDPPAHLVTALAGPMTYLVMLVGAGCALALTDHPNILGLLLHPCAPPISSAIASPTITLTQILQLTVWINWCLLLVSFLPVDPCGGAELLRGILWPMVGRSTAASATSRIAVGAAFFVLLIAVVIPASYSVNATTPTWLPLSASENPTIPTWLPLSAIAVFLLYGGLRHVNSRRYDVGLAIDEFDSDDEEWLVYEWNDEDREPVLVEHLQDKQQEALDRKRREREAHEDARVDAILLQLRDKSFEQLSEEDRATLKRASRRYRERRDDHDDED